jgi:hypothetical protein
MAEYVDKGLNRRLMEASRSGASAYLREYAELLGQIGLAAASSEVRFSRPLVAANSADAVNAVKVSLLYNDVSTLLIASSGQAQITILDPRKFGGESGFQITVPSDRDDIAKAVESGHINCGFMLPSSDHDDQLYSDLAPLIGQGRLIISPTRLVMFFAGKMTPEGARNWETIQTDPLAPLEVWKSEDAVDSDSIKTVTSAALNARAGDVSIDQRHQLVLPYIEGVSLSEYAKIIDDASDQIAALRVELASYLKQLSTNNDEVEVFRKDVLQPKIDRIERDFRRITTASNIRTGGLILGSAVMCAATFATGGVAAAIAGVAGTVGLVGGAKELADRYEKLSALKDDPLHVLWRLKQQGQS